MKGDAADVAMINSQLAASDQSFTPLGGNLLQRWITENGIQTINNQYWQIRQLPDGNIALVRVKPSADVLRVQAAVVVGVEGAGACVFVAHASFMGTVVNSVQSDKNNF